MSKFYAVLVSILTPLVHLIFPYRLTKHAELPEGAAIICANHSSYIDAVIVAIVFGRKNHLRFMGKAELFNIPVIGWIITKIGALSADRDGKDVNALRQSIQILKEHGKLMLFPEGTRVSDDDASAAKVGAVRLASKHNAPIVPVYISRDKKAFRRFDVCVGEPYLIGRVPREEFPNEAERLMNKISELRPQ